MMHLGSIPFQNYETPVPNVIYIVYYRLQGENCTGKVFETCRYVGRGAEQRSRIYGTSIDSGVPEDEVFWQSGILLAKF
jgi:hypothetical protein